MDAEDARKRQSRVVKHLPRISSDHCPILLQIDNKKQHNNRDFRFENMWCSYEAAKGIIAKSWRKNDFVNSNDILERKIKRSLKNLYFWSKKKLKELNLKIQELKNEILQLQDKEAKDGGMSHENLIILRSKKDSLNILKAHYTKEELILTLGKMDNKKSPEADGANACFFKNYWNIIEEATWNAIDEFFKSGRMPEQWKDTVAVLIPKVQNAKGCSKFRPICLCQMVYKLAAGMILKRFKSCLPQVISDYQGAFVPGRSISDNCLIS
ncbi:uncharacterized protein LOC110103834 [Dendrobium catenatum]|uniref:uncharacterized protein LOC110103834 n=1 Tax=Dendrobium catenatum TaxID=906689 RepID=UPI0009F35EB6|nr:uncharacterized protein LOC110103834 [Dendrobium catenatum]